MMGCVTQPDAVSNVTLVGGPLAGRRLAVHPAILAMPFPEMAEPPAHGFAIPYEGEWVGRYCRDSVSDATMRWDGVS